jgi:hypothetical protein
MVDDDEWAWVREQAMGECDHLLLATSVPVLLPGGCTSSRCGTRRCATVRGGRRFAGVGERIRRAIDLEDWPAFRRSFDRFVELLRDVATPDRPDGVTATVDDLDPVRRRALHLRRRGSLRPDPTRPAPASSVHQLVCSPMRNALVHRERAVIRAAVSTPGRWHSVRSCAGAARAPRPALRWDRTPPILFNNAMALLEISGQHARSSCTTAATRPIVASCCTTS